MHRTRRTRINSTLSFSFPEIQPRTGEAPHLPKELNTIVDFLKFFEAQLRDHKFKVLTDHQLLLCFLRPRKTSQKLAQWQAYMREFDLVIQHTARNEHLLAAGLARKH